MPVVPRLRYLWSLIPMLCVASVAFGADERIYFTVMTGEAKSAHIVSTKPDGSDQKQLTKGEGLAVDPAPSPDGKLIAFVVVDRDKRSSDVYTMNVDGSDRKKLTSSPDGTMAMAPAWSADGKRLAYGQITTERGGPRGSPDLMVVDADGKNAKKLGTGILPDWSPDGKHILYTTFGEGPGFEPRLKIMDADGKNSKQILEGRAMAGAWSPDGKRIACMAPATGEDAPRIFVMDADGKNAKQLTKGEQVLDLAPRWSGDSKHIFLTRVSQGGEQRTPAIYVIESDGSNFKKLTKGEGMEFLHGASLFLMGRGSSSERPKQ